MNKAKVGALSTNVPECRIDKTSRISGEAFIHGEHCRHFSNCRHDKEDAGAYNHVRYEETAWTTANKSNSSPDDKASTQGAANGNHGHMTLLKVATQMGVIVLNRLAFGGAGVVHFGALEICLFAVMLRVGRVLNTRHAGRTDCGINDLQRPEVVQVDGDDEESNVESPARLYIC